VLISNSQSSHRYHSFDNQTLAFDVEFSAKGTYILESKESDNVSKV
jgi:hypothetical protein